MTADLPVPDPTYATTQAIERVVTQRHDLTNAQLAVRDAHLDGQLALTESQLIGLRELVVAKLDAIDKANSVLAANVNRTPTLLQVVQEQITTLMDVKFAHVAEKFADTDQRLIREGTANNTAVQAAFAAADKAAAASQAFSTAAILKSEAGVAETIKTNAVAQVTGNKALSDKIDDDRDRMNRLEQSIATLLATKLGAVEARQENVQVKSDNRQIANLGLAALVVFLTLVSTVAVVYGIVKG